MQIDAIQIVNFRSIKYLEFGVRPSCQILVGVNESGKSNILRALSLLSPEVDPVKADVRDPLPDEPPVEESYVKYTFRFSDEDRAQLYDSIVEQLFDESLPLWQLGSQNFNLEQILKDVEVGIYRIDCIDRKKYGQYRTFRSDRVLTGNWVVAPATMPQPTKAVGAEQSYQVTPNSLVNTDAWNLEPAQSFAKATLNQIDLFIGRHIIAYVNKQLPRCIIWQYSEQHLLPGSISTADFAANPENCLPLKHMFELAGINEIAEKIEEAEDRNNGMRNLLNRVSIATTRHIRDVWPEHNGVEIGLAQNGEHIDAYVKDTHNVFDLSRRSDGFKRFITFLLMISTRVKSKSLQNTLLLYDEPDISLHPSGARFLRDELIKIASSNHVIYSTHSIFMIDREEIDRHWIVKKTKEITTVVKASRSNMIDEEVIFNALGYSLFEVLKHKNIIFEGRRDRTLFEKAMSRVPHEYAALKTGFQDVGRCFARGVKELSHVSALLELANRKCIILSDADSPAREAQARYEGEGTWIRYDQVQAGTMTAEDFIVNKKLVASFTAMINERSLKAAHLDETHLPNHGKLAFLEQKLLSQRLPREEVKTHLNRFKDLIFEGLKSSEIEDTYYDFLTLLAARLS